MHLRRELALVKIWPLDLVSKHCNTVFAHYYHFLPCCFYIFRLQKPISTIHTSILHDAFISIFIALLAVITHYITILMPILSYFIRFTWRGRMSAAGIWCLLHNLLLVDVVGPPSAEVCRIVANFPQVDDLRFINPWEAPDEDGLSQTTLQPNNKESLVSPIHPIQS